MSDIVMRKRKKSKQLLAMNLGIVFLALLTVIPVNLTMRRYGYSYDLVPFATSLICCVLPLLLSFPFINYSRQIINQYPTRYRFLSKKFRIYVLFILLMITSLSLVLYFYHQNPIISYQVRYPYILSMVAIPLSFLTSMSTLLVVEMFNRSQESEKKTPSIIWNILSWIAFALVILVSFSQFCIYIVFIVVGVCFGVYLCLFIIAMVKFVKNEKEKKIKENGTESKPVSSWIMIITYTLVTIAYFTLIILYMVFLVKGYLIINFDEFYSGFFLAIQGSYVLFLIIFYSTIYRIMIKKKMFD